MHAVGVRIAEKLPSDMSRKQWFNVVITFVYINCCVECTQAEPGLRTTRAQGLTHDCGPHQLGKVL